MNITTTIDSYVLSIICSFLDFRHIGKMRLLLPADCKGETLYQILGNEYAKQQYTIATMTGIFDDDKLNVIKHSPNYSYYYAVSILGSRYYNGEKAIASSAKYLVKYIDSFIHERYEEYESVIMTDARSLKRYLNIVGLPRLYSLENMIIKCPESLVVYYIHTVNYGNPFDKAISVLENNSWALKGSLEDISKMIPNDDDPLIKIIGRSPELAFDYVNNHLCARWPRYEKCILSNPITAAKYITLFELHDLVAEVPVEFDDSFTAYDYSIMTCRRIPDMERSMIDNLTSHEFCDYMNLHFHERVPEIEDKIFNNQKLFPTYLRNVIKKRDIDLEVQIHNSQLSSELKFAIISEYIKYSFF